MQNNFKARLLLLGFMILISSSFPINADGATENDTQLLPPSGKTCLILPLTGYTASEKEITRGHQTPMFYPYDVNDDWWDNLVAEQLQARIPVTMAFTRGADKPGDRSVLTGIGNMNPYRLKGLIDAFDRADVAPELMKVSCFSDSAPYRLYQKRLFRDVAEASGVRFDWSHEPSWDKVLWEIIFEPFFETIPSDYWFRVGKDQRPLIRIWGLNNAANINHKGNLSRAIARVADKFEERFKERPIFTISFGDRDKDPTLEGHADIYGFGTWFNLDRQDAFVFANYQGRILGGGCPGYHGPSDTPRTLPRRDGDTLRWGLEEATRLGASHTIIEGWKNSHEGAALFRSLDDDWPYPNTYINILRRFTDPETPTIRLEAEGCDQFVDLTKGNSGERYRRSGDLDIKDMPDSNGWCVFDIQKGESITHRKVYFSPGRYRISIRYATAGGAKVRARMAGKALPIAELRATASDDTFDIAAIGDLDLRKGEHNLQLKFLTPGLSVDWLFVKKINE